MDRGKKMVFLPFVTSNVELLESKRKHGVADLLHRDSGQMRISRLKRTFVSLNLVEVTLKTKLQSHQPWTYMTFLEELWCWA